jgi:hypothetical protein
MWLCGFKKQTTFFTTENIVVFSTARIFYVYVHSIALLKNQSYEKNSAFRISRFWLPLG